MISPWGRAALEAAHLRLPAGVSCLARTSNGPFTLTDARGVSVSAVTWRDLPNALARLTALTSDLEAQLAASLAARGIE